MLIDKIILPTDWVYLLYPIVVKSRAGEPEPEPVGAGCFWLLGAGAA